MSQDRRTQWSTRLDHLQALREQFISSGRYDRAYRAYLMAQRLYERWADEMFRQQNSPAAGANPIVG
jgi:hypothetical protein